MKKYSKKPMQLFRNPMVIFIVILLIFLLFFFSRQEPFSKCEEAFTCKEDGSGAILEDDEDLSFNISGTCQDFKSMLLGSTIEEIQDLV